MLEGEQRKVYGDGVGHLWLNKDGFMADYAAGHAHISEKEINAALHAAGVGRSVLRIKGKTYRCWKTTDTAFPHPDGHERRNRAGVPMPVPGGLPTATMQSPFGSLTAQVNEDWEIDKWEDRDSTGSVTTIYVNVRTGETRHVLEGNERGNFFCDAAPIGSHFVNPKHSAKRQAWDCINHESQWLPCYYKEKFDAARDAGLSLTQLWLVLEDLVAKIERRATYAHEVEFDVPGFYACADAAEFMAGPRWDDMEPEFSSARELTGRHPVNELKIGQRQARSQLEPGNHTVAEIRAAMARGDPMYVSPPMDEEGLN